MAPRGSLLVMQSGGPTPVVNQALAGVVDEARTLGVARVYGAFHGLEGLLSGDLTDLTDVSRARLGRIARTPSAAMGSTRRRLADEDVAALLDSLRTHDIRYLHIIGGNDSAETGHRLAAEAAGAGWELAVVNVPKTIDNDLVLTDHCPGYGSAARFIALATLGAGRDAEAMATENGGTVIEVMGRDAGWLPAASALGKREDRDAPHFVGIPEVPVDVDRFVEVMADARARHGFAVAVVSENARGPDGVIGAQGEPYYVDEFGHPYYEGPARFLAKALATRLGRRVRVDAPGSIQRSLPSTVSSTDARESEMAGRAAVAAAITGESDRMVTLARSDDDTYRCETGLATLADVAGRVRTLPKSYYDRVTSLPTEAFYTYAAPLLGPALPRFERLLG